MVANHNPDGISKKRCHNYNGFWLARGVFGQRLGSMVIRRTGPVQSVACHLMDPPFALACCCRRFVLNAHQSMAIKTSSGGTTWSATPMISLAGWSNRSVGSSESALSWTVPQLASPAIPTATGVNKRIVPTPIARLAT